VSTAACAQFAESVPSIGMSGFFDDFQLEHIDLDDVTLRVRHGGSGPPVLLLHGHPRTHATWHRVAPLLARKHTVVCPDLRGYGKSSKPKALPDHAAYSKRAMAADCVALMRKLGHERFAIVGHDRGAYVAFRAAMDHPQAIERVVVLDAVPIVEALERCNERFARLWWHWFFFAQADKPERAILADPDTWYANTAQKKELMGDEAYADYRSAVHDPDTVHAMLEDYRAGLGIDRLHDEADRRARKIIECPLLVLWALRDDMELLYGDPLAIWRAWARDPRGHGLPSGHHMAEEVPNELAGELMRFLDEA
jgi:haloacetate dehalogenase